MNNNKTKYIKPNLDIMNFETADIIQTSESPFGPTPGPGPLFADIEKKCIFVE